MNEKVKKVKNFIENHPDSGFYLTKIGFWPFKHYVVGDIYGPMNPGRYMTIDEFIKWIPEDI